MEQVSKAAFFVPALVALVGCSPDSRQGVTGTVLLDGAPLSQGVISFQPADGTRANSAGSAIQDGKFEIPAAKGLPPGKYQVFVQAVEKTGRMVVDPMKGRIPEVLDVSLRGETPLEATITAGGENHFDYKLIRGGR